MKHLAKSIHSATGYTTEVWCDSGWRDSETTEDVEQSTCTACLEVAATFGEKCRVALVAFNAARTGTLTVDTITDAQIRELHQFSMKQIMNSPDADPAYIRAQQEAWLQCEIALDGPTLLSRRTARENCAEILNEYVARTGKGTTQ